MCAKTATKNTTTKRTSTGHAASTSLSGVGKCGGAAVSEVKINPAVNSANMSLKMRMKTMNFKTPLKKNANA